MIVVSSNGFMGCSQLKNHLYLRYSRLLVFWVTPVEGIKVKVLSAVSPVKSKFAHHEAKNAQNFEWKVNGKAQFSEIPP